MALLDQLLDPERRAEAKKQQQNLRSVLGHRVIRQPAQANHLHGLARVSDALDQLTNGGATDEEAHKQLYLSLAMGFALQGKFAEAATFAPEGPYRDEYLARQKAVDNINEQQCGDPPVFKPESRPDPTSIFDVVRQEHAGSIAGAIERMGQTQHPIEKVWNGKRTITFTKCLMCGAISAYA